VFICCSQLVQDLLIAKRDFVMSKVVKKLSRYDAVIIDDIGYVQHSRQEMEVLFTFLTDRYERGSLMITSNLPFSKWEQIFKDPMNASAAIDRLAHHSVILELNIEKYRMQVAKKNKSKKPDGPAKGSK
jgi:DNA replication protein DnaC